MIYACLAISVLLGVAAMAIPTLVTLVLWGLGYNGAVLWVSMVVSVAVDAATLAVLASTFRRVIEHDRWNRGKHTSPARQTAR
jgi:hypothetical protein